MCSKISICVQSAETKVNCAVSDIPPAAVRVRGQSRICIVDVSSRYLPPADACIVAQTKVVEVQLSAVYIPLAIARAAFQSCIIDHSVGIEYDRSVDYVPPAHL